MFGARCFAPLDQIHQAQPGCRCCITLALPISGTALPGPCLYSVYNSRLPLTSTAPSTSWGGGWNYQPPSVVCMHACSALCLLCHACVNKEQHVDSMATAMARQQLSTLRHRACVRPFKAAGKHTVICVPVKAHASDLFARAAAHMSPPCPCLVVEELLLHSAAAIALQPHFSLLKCRTSQASYGCCCVGSGWQALLRVLGTCLVDSA